MNRNFVRFSTGWYGKLAAALSTVIVSAVAIMAVSSSRATVQSATAAGLPSRQAGLPLYFIPNRGQADREVLYTARMSALTAYFTSREAIFRSQGATVRVSLAGANPSPLVEGQGILEGKANFLLGDKPDQWRTGVPLYKAIVYRQAYPGVDLFYRSSERQLKSEFQLAPGADPRLIRLTYSGVAVLRVDNGGALVLSTAAGEMREQKPDIYQEVDRRRVPVAGRYRLLGANQAGFEIGPYDRTRPLVIDPVLSYSTYLGGSGMDSARAVAADATGNAYVLVTRTRPTFPPAVPSRDAMAAAWTRLSPS